MIDEKACRKATFDERNSVPVGFAAGIFFVPKPYLRLRPTLKGGRVQGARLTTPDAEFDELRRAAVTAGESEAFDAYVNLAAYMLGVNYTLDDEQLAEILTLDVPAGDDGWPSQILDVAHGRGAPKAGTAGSD